MRSIAKSFPLQTKLEGEEEYPQFGNNFFGLFLALEIEKLGQNIDSSDVLSRDFIKKIRKAELLYGERWMKFLEDNALLISDIQKVLKQVKLLRKLEISYIKLITDSETYHLGYSINKEININGIGLYIWNKVNPLLEEANKAMESAGIEPKDFYG